MLLGNSFMTPILLSPIAVNDNLNLGYFAPGTG